jgi:hypothetical protein
MEWSQNAKVAGRWTRLGSWSGVLVALGGTMLCTSPAAHGQAALDPLQSPPVGDLGEPLGFGQAVAVDGERLVVVALDWPGTPVTHGNVAVFYARDADGRWQPDGFVESQFGASAGFPGALDLDGDLFLAHDLGQLGVWERQGPSTWVRVATLLSPDPTQYTLLGNTALVDGEDVFVVGASPVPAPQGTTALFQFRRQSDGTWSQAQAHLPSALSSGFASFARVAGVVGDAGRLVVQVDGLEPLSSSGTAPWLPTQHLWVEYERGSDGTWQELGVFHSKTFAPGALYSAFELRYEDGDLGFAHQNDQGQFRWRFLRREADGSWTQSPDFPATLFPAGEHALSDGHLVSARRFDPTSGPLQDAGTVILYRRQPNGTWMEVSRFGSHRPHHHEYFGWGLAADGGVIYATVPHEGNAGPGGVLAAVGTVYSFALADLGAAVQCAQSSLSLSTGGTIWLSLYLQGPGGSAISSAWVLGSATGTAPGVPLSGGQTLPLVPDGYTDLTRLLANQGPFDGTWIHPTFGVAQGLGTGQGVAAITLPPLPLPVLVGLELHHAAVGLDPVSFAPLAVGGPVATTLVP